MPDERTQPVTCPQLNIEARAVLKQGVRLFPFLEEALPRTAKLGSWALQLRCWRNCGNSRAYPDDAIWIQILRKANAAET
jgi:hypothetical protein